MELLHGLVRVRFLRYIVASALSLGCDMGAFLLLLASGAAAMPASAAGYAIGIVAHWLLSSRTVFAGQVAADPRARHRQKVLFVGSALVGLAVTSLVVGAATTLGADPRLGKLLAVGASFAVTWLLRRQVVFA